MTLSTTDIIDRSVKGDDGNLQFNDITIIIDGDSIILKQREKTIRQKISPCILKSLFKRRQFLSEIDKIAQKLTHESALRNHPMTRRQYFNLLGALYLQAECGCGSKDCCVAPPFIPRDYPCRCSREQISKELMDLAQRVAGSTEWDETPRRATS